MPIDPSVEVPTRAILGAFLRGEADTVESKLDGLVRAGLVDESLALVTGVAGAAVLDMTGGERPTDEWLRDTSRKLAELDAGSNSLTADEAKTFLCRVVFGGERLDTVLSVEDAVRVPYVVLATLLASSAPEDRQWWEWLDFLEVALEAAPDAS